MTPEERLRQLLDESAVQAGPSFDARVLDDARKAYTPARMPARVIVSLAAGVLVIIVAVSLWRAGRPHSGTLLEQIQAGQLDAGPVSPTDPAGDRLLPQTDPPDLLLTTHIQALTSDPLLRPHSVWDQDPPHTTTGKL